MPLDNSSCNMWVFRDGRSTMTGESVRSGLATALHQLPDCGDGALVSALLWAGECECALEDASAAAARTIAGVTDAVAAALLHLPGARAHLDGAAAVVAAVPVPPQVSVATPEGFAYYALHPLDYSELAKRVPVRGGDVAVVGIRSIGASLSAVVSATMAGRGLRADRITVRPNGHPYDRRTRLGEHDLRWVARHRARQADFVVVDEGPGISGSSFLSVGDALLEAGVERERITFLCSRAPDPDQLTAPGGPARWRAFRSLAIGRGSHIPDEAKIYCGGGEWRHWAFRDDSDWPAVWTQMERLKFLSADRKTLFKFIGLGRYGDEVAARAACTGEAGFAPVLLGRQLGFARFPYVEGRPANSSDLHAGVISRIASYCAARARFLNIAGTCSGELEEMVRFNVAQEFGAEAAHLVPPLGIERPIITDSRMQPFEWVVCSNGSLLKTDTDTHGDDHFFPGPTDIAWDLAGAITEWQMTPAAATHLIEQYTSMSGDDVRPRLVPHLLAYAVFRMAYCAMAAFVEARSPEAERLRRAHEYYRRLAHARLRSGAEKEIPTLAWGETAPAIAAD